jgi:hypothetical protein
MKSGRKAVILGAWRPVSGNMPMGAKRPHFQQQADNIRLESRDFGRMATRFRQNAVKSQKSVRKMHLKMLNWYTIQCIPHYCFDANIINCIA